MDIWMLGKTRDRRKQVASEVEPRAQQWMNIMWTLKETKVKKMNLAYLETCLEVEHQLGHQWEEFKPWSNICSRRKKSFSWYKLAPAQVATGDSGSSVFALSFSGRRSFRTEPLDSCRQSAQRIANFQTPLSALRSTKALSVSRCYYKPFLFCDHPTLPLEKRW